MCDRLMCDHSSHLSLFRHRRSIIVVPNPAVFEDSEGKIAELEAAVKTEAAERAAEGGAADGGKRLELIKLLQVGGGSAPQSV